MHRLSIRNSEFAVSEVIGGILLIFVAVVIFSAIYAYVYPLPLPEVETDVKLMGYIDGNGFAVLEHMGGEALANYEIFADNQLIYSNDGDSWDIGESCYPLSDAVFLSEDEFVHVVVYSIEDDSGREPIFDGILRGESSQAQSLEIPLLISSLRTNTIDEDLICYNYTMVPDIVPLTNIYNWYVNDNSIFDLLMAFDTDSGTTVKDYSGDALDGTINSATWVAGGIVGGGYSFDGVDDFITIPYCFENSVIDDITVETWFQTNELSEIISSFNRDKYWEIGIQNGFIRWSTHSSEGTNDLIGSTFVSDGFWHHLVLCFDSTTGESTIYIDGSLDETVVGHTPGLTIGTGDSPSGSIGLGSSFGVEETIFSTSFETSTEESKWSEDTVRTTADWWETYDFDRRASDALSPRTGTYSIGGTGNFDPRNASYNREGIDISGYSNVTLSVWYSYESTEDTDEFGFYYEDGGSWVPIFEDLTPEIGQGNQLPWTYAETQIPDDIDDLVLQFWWSSSESREFMAVDDLQITGIPLGVGSNFSGTIDEFYIYNRVLSSEQVYQNYLCSKDSNSNLRVIVSDETILSEVWSCNITPNDSTQDGIMKESNTLEIIGYGGG